MHSTMLTFSIEIVKISDTNAGLLAQIIVGILIAAVLELRAFIGATEDLEKKLAENIEVVGLEAEDSDRLVRIAIGRLKFAVRFIRWLLFVLAFASLSLCICISAVLK